VDTLQVTGRSPAAVFATPYFLDWRSRKNESETFCNTGLCVFGGRGRLCGLCVFGGLCVDMYTNGHFCCLTDFNDWYIVGTRLVGLQ